jgi:hypothetical protein
LWGLDGVELDMGHLLADPDAETVLPTRINNAQPPQVVGTTSATSHPFYWTQAGGIHLLAPPGESHSTLKGFNDAGEALLETGYFYLWKDENGDGRPQPEEFHRIDAPSGLDRQSAIALSNTSPSRVLLKAVEFPHANRVHWLIWSAGQTTDLGNPFPARVRDPEMVAMNDRGDLLGTGVIGKSVHAFLFRPLAVP